MRRHIVAARQENAPVLDEASTLFAQKQELETKKQLLDAFNRHFIISEDELLLLSSATDPVNDVFFATLGRVKAIHGDCQILLGTENQRLGLELMEQSSKTLNAGYQKLFRWLQREFKDLNLENPQISSVIRRALRALAERPTLFQNCLDFFAEAREHVLTDAFYAALTGSSTDSEHNPSTKPIEFHAHDPLRYVGDMLAWSHSTAVSEREALESLFISDNDEIKRGFEAGKEAEPWSVADTEAFDGRKALEDLVNRNLTGVARALRQRIEQVLQNHEDAILLYRISNLSTFYTSTFTKLLGVSSSLITTLNTLKDSALQRFNSVISETVSSIQSYLSPPPKDLRTPDFLNESLSQLAALLKSFDSSLTPAFSRASDFEPILSQALNPFLSACEKMARNISEPDASIFTTNCILAAQQVLSRYDFVQFRVSELKDQLSMLNANLTQYQHAFFLHTSGLHPLLSTLAPFSDASSDMDVLKIPTLAPFQPGPLADASMALDDFLPSALMDAMENLKCLSSRELARSVTADAAENFCEDFEFVEGMLGRVDELRTDEGEDSDDGVVNGDVGAAGGNREGEVEGGKGEVQRLRDLFPRTSGEIRVLLS